MKNTQPQLFRDQALDSLRQRLHGDVLLLPKLSHSLIILLILCWTIGIVTWASLSTFARKETVLGWLSPPSGIVRVYPRQPGTVKKVLVSEGEYVSAGQALVEISEQKTLTGGVDLQSSRIAEFESQAAIIERQLQRGEDILLQRLSDTKRNLSDAKVEATLIDKQISLLDERFRLLQAQTQKAATLREEGHLSATEFERIVNEKLTLQEELQALERTRVSQAGLIEGLHSQLNLLPQQAEKEKDQLKDRLSVLKQQKSQLLQQQSYSIVAARSGVINNLQVFDGEQIQADTRTPIMSILPKDAALEVQLLVPVRAAGFIETGQSLYIRYDAFPYQKFGLYEGEIGVVSRTIMLPDELINSPISITEPVYRVSAVLNTNMVSAYGKNFALRPGMTLSADIKLDERSIIEWLFEPLLSVRGNL